MPKMTAYAESKIREEQQKLIDCIGFELYLKIAKEFGGSSIYIAKEEIFYKGERNERVIRDFNDGLNYSQLAEKYKLTEVWIRKIINDTV